MAFDPDKYLEKKSTSGSFDPDAYLSNKLPKEEASPDISQLESILRGAAQGGSLGYSDELAGALESAAGSLGLVPDKTYEQATKEAREANKAAEQANPKSYLGGEIGGGLLTSLIPMGAASEGAMAAKGLTGVLGTMAKGAGIGAATGAAAGFGAGEGLEGSLEGAKESAKGGALLGSLLPVATTAVAKTGKAIASDLAGSDFGKKIGKVIESTKAGKSLEAGETQKELEALSESVSKELKSLLKDKAATIDDIAKRADEMLAENPKLNLNDILDDLNKSKKTMGPEAVKKLELIESQIGEAGKLGQVEKIVPAGSVVSGSEAKAQDKIVKKLAQEKAKIQKQILDILNSGAEIKDVAPLMKQLDEIETATTKIPALGTNRDVLTASVTQPKVKDMEQMDAIMAELGGKKPVNVTPGKVITEALPEKVVGDFTPIKTEKTSQLMNPELTSVEARDLKKTMGHLYEVMNDAETPEAVRNAYKETLEKVKNGVVRNDSELREELAKADEAYQKAKKLYEPLKIEKEKPAGLSAEEFQKRQSQQIEKKMADVPEWDRTETAVTSKEDINRFLNQFKELNPEMAAKLEYEIPDVAQRASIAKELAGETKLGTKGPLDWILGGGRKMIYKGAIGATKTAKELSDASPELVKAAANGASKITGTLLNDIADSPNRYSKTAAIFKAMQNPHFRSEMHQNNEE